MASFDGAARFLVTAHITAIYVILIFLKARSGAMQVDGSSLVLALRNTGGFDLAATFLEAVDLNRVLPESYTLLVPTDKGLEASGLLYWTINEALPTLQYHVVTRQISFQDLQQLPVGETLLTLLANSIVLITGNTAANFTLDDVPLSHPDIFSDNNVAVHGISGVMDRSSAAPSAAAVTALSPDNPILPQLPQPEIAHANAPAFSGTSSSLSNIIWACLVNGGLLLATSCLLLRSHVRCLALGQRCFSTQLQDCLAPVILRPQLAGII